LIYLILVAIATWLVHKLEHYLLIPGHQVEVARH